MTFRIGLTGGLAAGKSTAAELFRSLGVEVLDSDDIARDLVAPGMPALARLTDAFGPDILDAAGQLDRAALRARVFGDSQGRERLEAILHPEIRRELQRRSERATGPYCVLVIPLLIEKEFGDLVDRILVVDVPASLQRDRALARPGWTEEQVRGVLQSQCSREERLAAADDVIVNDSTRDALRSRIEALDAHYRQLAAGGAAREGAEADGRVRE